MPVDPLGAKFPASQATALGASQSLRTLSKVAFGLLMALVIARATILEGFRDPFEITPGKPLYPSAPGPATSLVLDALCCIPALLVLLRETIDPSRAARGRCSFVILSVLTAWVALSTRWADDKFVAICFAANLIAAVAVAWAASRLVIKWVDLRLVGAVAFGLLLVNIAQGLIYRYIELPDTVQGYQQHKAEFLAQRGWQPNDFYAKQFEQKLTNGELFGFTTSSNSYGAVMVLLAGISAGLVIQRISHEGKRSAQWAVVVSLALPATLFLLACTQSKAVLVSPVLFVALLAALWRWRDTIKRHPSGTFFTVLAAFVLLVASTIGFGVLRHRLPTDSLKFRWWYWTAAWDMFRARPWRGVGWGNFGQHYLRFRLPIASEEIKDPHNFLIRFLTETGIVGFGLALAWLGRLGWELAHQSEETFGEAPAPVVATRRNSRTLVFIAGVIMLGMLINIAASIDFNQPGSSISLELIKRLLFGCVMAGGAGLVLLRSLHRAQIDDRAAPWLRLGMLTAIGVFLIHNLIEFSLFENGALMIVALVGGAALAQGIGGQPARQSRRWAWGSGLLLAGAGAAVGMALLVIPTLASESMARQGDLAMQSKDLAQASRSYEEAFAAQPLDADYAYRAGRALLFDNGAADARQALHWFNAAIEANPSAVHYYMMRAQLEDQLGDRLAKVRDYQRAVYLNPTEVALRLQFAESLISQKAFFDARRELEAALYYNDQFPIEEGKRLNDFAICFPLAEVSMELGDAPRAKALCEQALADNERFKPDDRRRMTGEQVESVRQLLARVMPTSRGAF